MSAISFTEAIKQATELCLLDIPGVHVMGLGANYPNGLDGTMGDLAQRFPLRVHDMPCSENANTGMAVGMAISGLRPIVHHGRIEFALHAMDQIITQAAKWNFMFGGDYPCPLTIRIAMGRQWGNGPQHTLNHKSLFAVPGLRVVCPSTPERAFHFLHDAVHDQNPVIYLEPRWLYKTKQTIRRTFMPYPDPWVALPGGKDILIIAVGDMLLEALKAAKLAKEGLGVSVTVVDPGMIYPVSDALTTMMFEYGHVIIAENTHGQGSYGMALAGAVEHKSMSVMCAEDEACPTAPSLTKNYYGDYRLLLQEICLYTGHSYSETVPPTFNELNLPPTDNFDDYLP